MTDLGTLGGTLSRAFDINPKGQVVGMSLVTEVLVRAFLWDDGVMIDLGSLAGSGTSAFSNSWAHAINPAGEVVGESQFQPEGFGPFHATLWTPK